MPAVKPMAKAPQKVTRKTAGNGFAPPVVAPNPPSTPRNKSAPIDTAGIIIAAGTSTLVAKGRAAPMLNVAADVKAA
jgi:hypothetical protein